MNLPAKQRNFLRLQGLKSLSLAYGGRRTIHHNKIEAGISSGLGESRRITMFRSSRTPTRTCLDFNDAFSPENISRLVNKLKGMKSRKTLIASCTEEAAVFVPFCTVNSTPSVLFTLRSNQLNSHRGEVSFPGGKKDPEDKSVRETAIREMEEELGLDRSCVEVWAQMPATPNRTGKTAIYPILGFIGEIDVHSPRLNPNEEYLWLMPGEFTIEHPLRTQRVSSVFLLSLQHICDARNYGYTKFKSQIVLPVFLNGPHRVWGLTAIILENVLLTLVPDRYPRQVAVLHNGSKQS